MSTQRAWQYNEAGGSLDTKMFLNSSAPRPSKALAPDEVLVHVISAAINPVDYKIAEARFSNLMVKLPSTLANDYCGRVVESGSAIDSLVNGQLVFGTIASPFQQQGSLSEYIITNLDGCVPLPAGVDPDDAAALGIAALTAYQSIEPYVKEGDKVFINGGSGGTGIFAVQIAKILGCHVTTSCSGPNVKLCKDLGADEVIDYRSTDVSKELQSAGMVYDLVVDNVSTPADLYVLSNNFLKESGTFVQVGIVPDVKGIGAAMSRMLRPSFLGGGKRKYKLFACTNKEDDLRQLGEVISGFGISGFLRLTVSVGAAG